MSSIAAKKAAWAKVKREKFDISKDSTANGAYLAAKADGHRIFYNIWKPKGTAKAEVLFFHGLGEHCLRYEHVFSKFADAGIVVRAIDWRGHGRTYMRNASAIQGFHESFDQVFEDMFQVAAVDIEGVPKGLPLFVFGHSMGGLLALSFVHKNKSKLPNLRGCIAQAPALSAGKPIPMILQFIIMWLGGFLGKVTQPNELELDGLCSHDPVVDEYVRDPLNHGQISLRLAKDMLVHQKLLLSEAATFTTPLIMYHSCLDRFTAISATEKFMDTCGSTDKKYNGFSEGQKLEHEIHNEPSVSNTIISEYIEWIMERAAAK
ncbi:Alpha/Beta hydrolase protein [Chytriomyces cf. hyalinus JEL632]|nr:Alpha/Beta hydrolase protein [Chytriomyces cf. hyalinus JEL632]